MALPDSIKERAERGAKVVQEIENAGGKARFIAADLADADDVRRLANLGLAGCIAGRALYEGRLRLAEMIHVTNSIQLSRNSWRSTV